MTSRHHKEPYGFNLQSGLLSLDGRTTAVTKVEPEDSAPHDRDLTPDSPPGKIEVSNRAIAHLASMAIQRCYGVVGLASKHSRPGWAELLRREEQYKGVDVAFNGDQIVVELYVILEYGTRVSEVARNIMSNVKFALESALGVPAVQVNVNIQGIRVSGTQES